MLVILVVLSFFPLDVLDEIWDVIESVSEGCLTYSCEMDKYHWNILVLCEMRWKNFGEMSSDDKHKI